MIVACYHAAADGGHADCRPYDYDVLWRLMQQSVEEQGYTLTHLTTSDEPGRCDQVFRIIGDPETIMFTRELAWLTLLRSLDPGATAVLIEPDCILRKRIPPLRYGCDFMLLSRKGRRLPSGFRMANRNAVPFYESVVQHYDTLPHTKKRWDGDTDSIEHVVGIKHPPGAELPMPFMSIGNHTIEVRDWIDYTSKLWRNAVAWNFKGWSKSIMLDMANGKMPTLR